MRLLLRRNSHAAGSSSAGSSIAKSTGIAVLGGTVTSLTLLEKIADASNIPVVKGAAGAALEIIKLLQTMYNNKMDCADLVQRSTSLMVVILGMFKGKKEEEISHHLRGAVERLTVTFHEVLHDLRKVAQRGDRSLIGFLYTIDNANTLKGCAMRLDWAMQEFQVTSNVDSCLKDLERHNELVAEIREGLGRIVPRADGPSANTETNLPTSVMPPEPVIFGREAFIEQAIELILNNVSARIAVLGPGGIGKTCAALKIIHDERIGARFGKNRIWVPCDQATSIPLFVELIAKSLDLPSSKCNDRFKEVVIFLESSQELLVLLLDNLETPWDIDGQQSNIAQILARLAAIPTVSFIITMRGSQYPVPDKVRWSQPALAPLTPLELSAGRDAFLWIAPSSASDSQLGTLLKELDCMPLAVTLMARLAFNGETPTDLLSQWKEERTALLDQSGGDRGNSIEVSIKLSMMSNAVKNCPGAIAFLSILSKLPAGSLLSHIPDICPSIPNWRNVIRTLKRVALIYESADQSLIHMLSPVRSYVLLHHPLEARKLRDLQLAYFRIASKGDLEPGSDGFLLVHKEISMIEANMEVILLEALHIATEEPDAAIRASIHYSSYLYWSHPRIELIQAAAEVAKGARSNLFAKCLWEYGTTLLKCDVYDQAEKVLKEAEPEFIAIEDRHGAAQCLRMVGEILRMKNQYDEAEMKLKQAKSQLEELGDELATAQCLRSLGDLLQMKNQYTQARMTLEEATTKFDALAYSRGIAQCLRSFGEIYLAKNEYDRAENVLKTAKSLFEEIGDQLDTAKCLRILGDTLRMKNELDQAELTIKEAKSQFNDLADRLGVAQCLRSLGELLGMRDQYDEAEISLEQARSTFGDIGYRLGAAQCLRSLGDILWMKQQYDQARLTLEQAKSVSDSVQSPLCAAQCLRSLGGILLDRGHNDQALVMLEEAKSITALRLRSSYQAALDELGQARKIFESLRQTEWVAKCDKEIDLIHSSQNN